MSFTLTVVTKLNICIMLFNWKKKKKLFTVFPHHSSHRIYLKVFGHLLYYNQEMVTCWKMVGLGCIFWCYLETPNSNLHCHLTLFKTPLLSEQFLGPCKTNIHSVLHFLARRRSTLTLCAMDMFVLQNKWMKTWKVLVFGVFTSSSMRELQCYRCME